MEKLLIDIKLVKRKQKISIELALNEQKKRDKSIQGFHLISLLMYVMFLKDLLSICK